MENKDYKQVFVVNSLLYSLYVEIIQSRAIKKYLYFLDDEVTNIQVFKQSSKYSHNLIPKYNIAEITSRIK